MKLKNLTMVVAGLLMSYGVATAQNDSSTTEQKINNPALWELIKSSTKVYEGTVVGVRNNTYQARYNSLVRWENDKIIPQNYSIIQVKSNTSDEVYKIVVPGNNTYFEGDDYSHKCKVEFDGKIKLSDLLKDYSGFRHYQVEVQGKDSELSVTAVEVDN